MKAAPTPPADAYMAVFATGLRLFHLSAIDGEGGANMASWALELPLRDLCQQNLNLSCQRKGSTYAVALMLCHDPL